MEKTFKKIDVTPVELIRFQLAGILGKFDYIGKDHTLLAYIHLYGRDAKNKMIEDKLSLSRGSIENYISKYRRDKVIVGVGPEIKLNPGILIINESFVQTIQFNVI